MKAFICASLLLSLLKGSASFCPVKVPQVTSPSLPLSALFLSKENSEESGIKRREILKGAIGSGLVLTTSLFAPLEGKADGDVSISAAEIGSDASSPIAVIGAGGKVGNLCTGILSSRNLYTRGITRSGRNVLGTDSSYVSYASGDVTNYESIKNAISGSSGVIFAASASGKKKGGDPAHVDYKGLYNTAKACIECGVPKLVVISSGSVTRPDFVGFKATNLFVKYVYGDKIMDYKIAGEEIMRDLYTEQSKCSYCVVRPGGLSEKPAEGSTSLHLSQGDVYSSEVTREDVAQVTVAALLKGRATDFTTFELNTMGKGLSKVSADLETPPSALVHEGASTYDSLLNGLLTDSEMKSSYAQYISGFKGEKIEPVSSIV